MPRVRSRSRWALGDAVVEAVPDRSHGAQQAGIARRRPNAEEVDWPDSIGGRCAQWCGRVGVGVAGGYLDGVDDEFGADVIGDRPSHDPAAERVEDHRKVDLAGAGRVLGDVHDGKPQATSRDWSGPTVGSVPHACGAVDDGSEILAAPCRWMPRSESGVGRV